LKGDRLQLLAIVISADGTQIVRREVEGSVEQPAALGEELGRSLLDGGARSILEEVYGTSL
jgi:porphobilinogen deaminase